MATTYNLKRRNIPQELDLQQHHSEKLKFYKKLFVSGFGELIKNNAGAINMIELQYHAAWKLSNLNEVLNGSANWEEMFSGHLSAFAMW